MAGHRGGVKPGGNGRVVVAVSRTHGIGIAGFTQLLQRILAHRL
ncbi:Uncharacterised protein [Mycobacterium tuberculosis]|uniref:Uncharacterized protein n=1 Tax=Mycobacterium tuberculosis TaxID=1773 RepID=A0A654TDU4_MYCTX|nr:Uncharacterised protein [Mycobacterium tuberculosis]CFE44416.1 Uncharacterised protein [Mycobacterium tuberculosis]CFE62242.1 Uncharacterised protein [Mycobacterium tuberculosis]CFR88333.1 Uncharacterised protein [Mycobacterium tuberculosis]CFS04642.1 Uncharacterised protein [Mycobacterium tuberculosis]